MALDKNNCGSGGDGTAVVDISMISLNENKESDYHSVEEWLGMLSRLFFVKMGKIVYNVHCVWYYLSKPKMIWVANGR